MNITDMVSLRARGKYIAILSLASAVGLVSGIMMGAELLGEHHGECNEHHGECKFP
jgi:hypothetical protein